MSVSTHHFGSGSLGTQNDFDEHGWLDLEQHVDWEDLENLWQAWQGSGPWHGLSDGWHGDDPVATDADGEAHDGMDQEHQEHQGRPEHSNAPDTEGHDDNPLGDHRGRGHGGEAGDPAAAPDPEAHEHHHQQALADEAQHDETEANDVDGVNEAHDGADHEHQGQPEDTNAPDTEGHDDNDQGNHHGRGQGEEAGDPAAPDPEAHEHHHQQALADEAQHDETEANDVDGVDEAHDGADHEHHGQPENDNAPDADGHDGDDQGDDQGPGHGDEGGDPGAASDPEANEHHHQDEAQHDANDAEDEAHDGADHEHQGGPEDANAPDAEEHDDDEQGGHHGRGHGGEGGDPPAASEANEHDHQQGSADEAQHEETEGNDAAHDGAEDANAPGAEDGNEHGGHGGTDTCEAGQGDVASMWNDSFLPWSEMSAWEDVRASGHEGPRLDMSEEHMGSVPCADDGSSSGAGVESGWHGEDGSDQAGCPPSLVDHWLV